MISYVIATHNRPAELARTLARLGALGPHEAIGGAEVIVVDNASEPAMETPEYLTSGVPVRLLRRATNMLSAARNRGAAASDLESEWIVTLDDDSYPLDLSFLKALKEAPGSVGAVCAEVFVAASPKGEQRAKREVGGLPEVFLAGGVAIRRRAWHEAGGYDDRLHWCGEEYDFSARLLLSGCQLAFDRRFRVMHERVGTNRDMQGKLRYLVRNNGWLAQRYSPSGRRLGDLTEVVTRYARIARREGAMRGYSRGLVDLAISLHSQRRMPMDRKTYDRFTGLSHARTALGVAHAERPLGRTAIVERGKNAWVVEAALRELGVQIEADAERARTLVIGTMSPGPMLDALERVRETAGERRVVAPWVEAMRSTEATSAAAPVAAREVKPVEAPRDQWTRVRASVSPA